MPDKAPVQPELTIEHIGKRIRIHTSTPGTPSSPGRSSVTYLGTLVHVVQRTDHEGRLTQHVVLEGDPRSILLTDFEVELEGDLIVRPF